MPINEVYATLQTFLGGAYVNDFTRFGRQWRVFVQADRGYRTAPEDLGKFYVRNSEGSMIPMSSFVNVRTTTGPEYLVRFNLYRSVEIQGGQAQGYSSGQALDALEDVAKKTLPTTMGYAWNALSYQQRVASGSASTCCAVLGSSEPVGSSARTRFGRFASARATATRCCCPTDSLAGL